MILNKEQLNFLKSLPENEDVSITGVSESKMSIVYFLESEGLIDAKREVIHSRLDVETRTFKDTYGRILSISISEKGKAYLAELKHEKNHFV